MTDYTKLGYTMGKGHVKFFYPRLQWCLVRQLRLIEEMQRRNYTPTLLHPFTLIEGQHKDWRGMWHPTAADMKVNLARLVERDEVHYRNRWRKFSQYYRTYISTVATGSVSV